MCQTLIIIVSLLKQNDNKYMRNSRIAMSHLSCAPTVVEPLLEESAYRARGNKTFFILNSVEHETLNAHKYKKI